MVLIAAGMVGFYIRNDLKEIKTTEDEPVVGIVAETEDGLPYSIDIVPVDGVVVPFPDLLREVNFVKANEKTKAEIRTISTTLKTNPGKFSLWIDLSNLRKSIEDYEGAKQILDYLTKVAPESGIPYRNLADLYAFYLKDNVKAEQNILLAIEKDPQQIEYYFKAVEIYRDIIKNVTKARAIVEKGLKSNPGSDELEDLLINLK